MKNLYAYRGWILGAIAVLLFALPSDKFVGWSPMLTVSIVLFVFSVLLRIQARRSIGEHTRGFTHDADRLVTEGIYSRIRHPLYLSNTGIGIAFILSHLGFRPIAALFAAILVGFEVFLSRMEDRYLEGRFGNAWQEWAIKTPAFFPRILGTKSSVQDKPHFEKRSFARAFAADASTWFWLLVAIAIILVRKV